MGEWLLPTLLVLAVVLFVVTIVGHGIWILLATLFGSRGANRNTPQPRVNCPRCGGILQLGRCTLCDWPGQVVHHDRTAEVLENTRQQIERFSWYGLIDKSVSQKLVESLDVERRQYLEQSAAAAKPVAPATIPFEAEPATTEPAMSTSPLSEPAVMAAELVQASNGVEHDLQVPTIAAMAAPRS